MSRDDLKAFHVVAMQEHKGPLASGGYRDVPAALVGAARVEPRLERIGYQQYVKMSVVRRDDLRDGGDVRHRGALGERSSRRRRTEGHRAHAAEAVPMGGGYSGGGHLGYSLSSALRGKSAYFAGSSAWFGLLIIATMAAAAPALGGLLRAWRPGFREGRVESLELASAAAAAFLLLATGIGAALSRPSLGGGRARARAGATRHKRAPSSTR
ncbi:MAG: hypothetical protein IPK71_36960 [Myxococcales bacterium]|nr:hypothetical protein [Myxococcales bacterium]